MNTLAMEFTDGSRPGHRIVRLKGQLALETSSEFLEKMRADTSPVVILDLHDLDFLDSTGVGAIVRVHVGSESLKRRLGLANLGVRTRAALEVSGLLNVLAIFPTIDEAERHFT